MIDFKDGLMYGVSAGEFGTSQLWLNSYQTIGMSYEVEDTNFRNQYLVFRIVPKTEHTTAKCTYSVEETNPKEYT